MIIIQSLRTLLWHWRGRGPAPDLAAPRRTRADQCVVRAPKVQDILARRGSAFRESALQDLPPRYSRINGLYQPPRYNLVLTPMAPFSERTLFSHRTPLRRFRKHHRIRDARTLYYSVIACALDSASHRLQMPANWTTAMHATIAM